MNASQECPLPGLDRGDLAEIRAYLERIYAGVFTAEAIEGHLESWVGAPAAQWSLDIVRRLTPEGGRILDVGCGFGSFVVLSRQAGFEAYGLDLADYEIAMARKRLGRLLAEVDPGTVFRAADAMRIDPREEQFDSITLWNILEHVPDYRPLLRSVHALLRPGGRVFLVCPNYLAWRLEAHYHVPWSPGLYFSRERAARHLERLGKNPAYFREGIFYTTNWGVLRTLWSLGMAVYAIDGTLPLSARNWSWQILRQHWRLICRFLNPFAESVVLMAQKQESART